MIWATEAAEEADECANRADVDHTVFLYFFI